MIRLLLCLSLLLLAGCEPPKPRPKVALPIPTATPAPTPEATPTPADGIDTRASLSARIPGEVEALESRYREVLTSLTETTDALSTIRGQLDGELPDEQKRALAREAAGLRDDAQRLAREAKELQVQAAQVKATSRKLKALAEP